MKSAISNYDQIFYLNGTAFSGIKSINGGYSLNYEPIKTVGVGYSKQIIAEVPNGEINITKDLLYVEPFLNFTGESLDKKAIPLSGSVHYNSKSIGFQNGYLTSFGLSCSVGEVPQTDLSISVFGDFGKTISASGSGASPYISVPQVKDIRLTCSGSATNRINNFQYNINCPKTPIYTLSDNNAYVPVEVLSEMPVEVTANFTMEVDDYEVKKMYDMITSSDDLSFSINIFGTIFNDLTLLLNSKELTVSGSGGYPIAVGLRRSGINIFSANINNASLVSQTFNSSSDEFLSVNLSYRAYLMN